MFEHDEESTLPDVDLGDTVSLIMKVMKWAAILVAIICGVVAPILVVYCRMGADADASGTVTRAEYDANVVTVTGTGVLSYLKPVMAFWERIVFIVLPVVEPVAET